MDIRMVFAPVVGGIIGYITNDIAIKMLFHPRKPVYIGKWRVPFTPGLIPSQKERIARSVARVVSNQLLDTDTVKNAMLSDTTVSSLRKVVSVFFDKYKSDNRTVGELGEDVVGSERFYNICGKIENKVSKSVTKRVINARPGALIVDFGVEELKKHFSGGFMSMFINDDVIESLKESIVPYVDKVIEDKLPDIIDNETKKLFTELKGKKISDIYTAYGDKLPYVIDEIVVIYKRLIEDNMADVLRAIDIQGIVEEKVTGFDAVELEKMIFGIMKKELRAIVYLGALLGFLLGFVNVFLMK